MTYQRVKVQVWSGDWPHLVIVKIEGGGFAVLPRAAALAIFGSLPKHGSGEEFLGFVYGSVFAKVGEGRPRSDQSNQQLSLNFGHVTKKRGCNC